MFNNNLKICGHGLYGFLCHKCYPEKHTYMARKPNGMYRIFAEAGSYKAISRAKRLLGPDAEVYHRIHPNIVQEPKQDTDADSD